MNGKEKNQMNYSGTAQLRRFLNNPKVRKVLNTKPLEQGFSLIELVVVVAILAILAAVALPNFLNISKDAQIAAAKNTLATAVKECTTSKLRAGPNAGTYAGIQALKGDLNGFTLRKIGTTSSAVAGTSQSVLVPNIGVAGISFVDTDSCFAIVAEPTDPGELPRFGIAFDSDSGATTKNCNSTASTVYKEGCTYTASATSGTGTW